MKKGILVIVIVCAIAALGVLIYSLVKKSEVNTAIADGSFGGATLVMIEGGKYKLACEDAKTLSGMISDINKDFATNPQMTSEVTADNMTPAMKNFEVTMDVFGKALEAKLGDNKTLMEEVFQGIGEGVSNVFQVSIMTHLNMVPAEKLNEYIDVEYCGVAPKEGYISPLEMAMDVENMPVGEGMPAPKETAPMEVAPTKPSEPAKK